MPDFINRVVEKLRLPGFLKTLFDHNRFTAAALVVVSLAGGCSLLRPTVKSPISNQRVTRAQLDGEVGTFKATAQADIDAVNNRVKEMQPKLGAAYQDLSDMEAAYTQALDTIGTLVGSAVPGNYGGLVVTGLSILTTGLGMDNLRKGRVIASRPVPEPAPSPDPIPPPPAAGTSTD